MYLELDHTALITVGYVLISVILVKGLIALFKPDNKDKK